MDALRPPAPAHALLAGSAAARLLALARAGCVLETDLRAFGAAVLGHDLDAGAWSLPGLGRVALRPSTVAAALRAALAVAFKPQRVRLGASWVKDGAGKVASCVPAALPPDQFARWLRAATYAFLRHSLAPREAMRRERRAPKRYRTVALGVYGEYSTRAALGPEAALLASEALEPIFAVAAPEEREPLRLFLEGFTGPEIAARLGCSDRTIRRRMASLRERVRAAGVAAPDGDLGPVRWERSSETVALLRPMAPDEVKDWAAGYAASRCHTVPRNRPQSVGEACETRRTP